MAIGIGAALVISAVIGGATTAYSMREQEKAQDRAANRAAKLEAQRKQRERSLLIEERRKAADEQAPRVQYGGATIGPQGPVDGVSDPLGMNSISAPGERTGLRLVAPGGI